ncbi:MFS transporter, partial [Streptomyces sp. SID11233]|nr:MFS transporter [Streptomyces sp. SID11233]
VDEHDPSSFVLLFSIEAAMFLVLAAIAASTRLPHAGGISEAVPAGDGGKRGMRSLLKDRAMVQLSVLGFVIFFACYGQFDSGLAAY